MDATKLEEDNEVDMDKLKEKFNDYIKKVNQFPDVESVNMNLYEYNPLKIALLEFISMARDYEIQNFEQAKEEENNIREKYIQFKNNKPSEFSEFDIAKQEENDFREKVLQEEKNIFAKTFNATACEDAVKAGNKWIESLNKLSNEQGTPMFKYYNKVLGEVTDAGLDKWIASLNNMLEAVKKLSKLAQWWSNENNDKAVNKDKFDKILRMYPDIKKGGKKRKKTKKRKSKRRKSKKTKRRRTKRRR